MQEVIIFTDGACLGNPGPGAAAAIVNVDGSKTILTDGDPDTTNNRMELLAAIIGLESLPVGSIVTLYSDSQYLVNTFTKGWKRKKNVDLWKRLDAAAARHVVSFV